MGCNCSIFRRYTSIENVTSELRHNKIDDIILTLGIDYTKSNLWNGMNTFNNKSLHAIENNKLNPYQQVLSLVTKTLEPLLSFNAIQMLGFSDVYSQNRTVFPMAYRNNKNLNILENNALNLSEQVMEIYKKITPKVIPCNPSTYIPLIEASINIYKSKKKSQVLVIITDSDIVDFNLESNKISEAENYPISIICIGVGDSKFTKMYNIKNKNFQFVDFNKIIEIENTGRRAYKIFENLPKIYKETTNSKSFESNLEVIKPINQYFL